MPIAAAANCKVAQIVMDRKCMSCFRNLPSNRCCCFLFQKRAFPISFSIPNTIHIVLEFIYVNSLPNNKKVDSSKLEAFADDNVNVANMMEIVLNWEENIVGKGENAGSQHHLSLYQTTKFWTLPN